MREECNLVFDDPTIANEHQENQKNGIIRKTRMFCNRALLLLLISNLCLFHPRFHSMCLQAIMLETQLCEENNTYRVEHVFMGQKLLIILLLSIARRYRN